MARIRVFFTKKRIIWTAVIFVVVVGLLYLIFGRGGSANNIQTDTVKRQDIQKTVLTTGEVVSSTNLDLSFQSSGVVTVLNVKEGDAVKAGQVLANLNQSTAWATLQSAQGALAQAQANYAKVSAAATVQDVAVSQATVDVATTAVTNAKQSLIQELTLAYNDANGALFSNVNNFFHYPVTTYPQFLFYGTVQSDQQLVSNVNNERVDVYVKMFAWKDELSNLSDTTTDKTVTDALLTLNTTHNFLSDLLSLVGTYSKAVSASDITTIPSAVTVVALAKNTIDSTIATLTSDSQIFRSSISSLNQAKASFALKQSPSRPEDIAAAQAQVTSAQGQFDMAQAMLGNTIIRAPMDGTVTQINVKLGEQAVMGAVSMKLQNVSDLHAEADVSEADIVSVTVGQSIDYTFDALGPDKHFAGKVLTINPASTVISGVVDYKVTGNFTDIPGIKPGMTANMTILVAEKKNVLVVPSSAVINQKGKRYVRVIDDPKKKTYHQVEVTTGLEADAGLTEIVSGLTEGQGVVTFIK